MLARSRMLLAEFGQPDPPFIPEALGHIQGIIEVRRRDIPFDACLLPVGSHYRVDVCKYHRAERQSFSIAHETAHTFLIELEPCLRAPKREAGIGKFRNGDFIEELCDSAAAELILPMSLFARHALEAGPSLESALSLSSMYRSSLISTARRIAETDLWKCHCVIWGDTNIGERTNGSLEAKVVFTSPAAARISPGEIGIQSDSTVYEALSTNRIAKRREQLTLAGEVHDYYVESMRLGNGDFGRVLSMILLAKHPEYAARHTRKSLQMPLFR